MKTLHIFATIAVIVLFVAASCKKTEGNWKKMKLDKTEVVFNSEGGEEIVTVLNYSALWLGGAETYRFVNAEWQVDRLFSPQNSDVAITQDVLEGDWIHALVPDKGKSNKVIITVDKNEQGNPRRAYIQITYGDAGAGITVTQE